VLQGLAGGGLQPSSQGVLLDAFPPEKQGAAQTMFGVAALLAPVVGPTLGGYLTVQYNWRWIFYINLPVGALALLMCYFVVHDPEYLQKQRAELRRQPLNFDYIGLGLLALVMSCWEIMLSKGQEWDWLGDPFWRIQTLLILFVLGLGWLIFREMRISNPIVNFRVLGERNLAASCIIIFCAYAVLYASSTSLPGLLQAEFGYDAYVSGLVQSPSGIFSIVMMLVVGFVIGRGTDARWLIAGGLLVMAAGCYWFALMNIYISPEIVIWPRVVIICGLSMIFAPLNVAAFKYTPQHLRGAAVGMFALLRNEGGSVGTSMAQTMEQRRLQFHVSRIGEFIDPLNQHVNEFAAQGKAFFYQQFGDPAGAMQQTWQALEDQRQQQAGSMAYFDVFYLCAVLGVALIVLVFFMKRSVAEKGAHIGAE
jgi:DHA2 family multidrug resistance protein